MSDESYERKSDECEFYYYDHGYCCAVKREKEGSSSIDSDLVGKYCWHYNYRDCLRYKYRDEYYRSYNELEEKEASGSSSGPCFLTSACVEARELSDNCYQLQTLRAFRDGYLAGLPEGEAEIQEYYRIAPIIVEKIKAQPDALEILDRIYNELVEPCVGLILSGDNEKAHQKYRDYVARLQKQYT